MRGPARGDERPGEAMSGRFAPGDAVRVRNDWPEASGERVHIRTPHFLRGHDGVIERVLGSFRNPEELAFGKPGLPPRTLYQVKFAHRALFPEANADPRDTLTADIYEHWLEPKRS